MLFDSWKKPIEGNVINRGKGGYKIKVFDKIIGFIPDSLVIKRKSPLEVGERVSVTCIKANEDFDNFVFDLT